MILMQNPGADEERHGIPACGKTGEALNTQFLPLAGLQRGRSISVGNVLKCRVGPTNDLPTGDDLRGAIDHCTRNHLVIPETTRLVILQGKLALTYATNNDKHSIHDWRGFLIQRDLLHNPIRSRSGLAEWPDTYATIHTADTFRDSTMSWVSQLDWRRVGEIRSGQYPSPRPYWVQCPTDGVDANTREFFADGQRATRVVLDTEFIPGTNHLTILGIGLRLEAGSDTDGRDDSSGTGVRPQNHARRSSNVDGPFKVLSVDWKNSCEATKSYISLELTRIVRRTRVVFHNAMADLPVLEAALGITYNDYAAIEDTMLAHAILWCELPHTLEFLSSIYGKHGKFKHLRGSDELLYNYGDVVDTESVWQGMESGFRADARAEEVYRSQSLRLIPILFKARTEGIRVNKSRVIEVFNEYFDLTKRISRYAQLSVGYPINLNSGEQLKHYLYTVRRYPVQIDKDTKRPTTGDDAVNRLRQSILPFDTSRELTFDIDDEKRLSITGRVAAGADPILESRALWASTWHTVNNYIVGLCNGVYQEQSQNKRKKARERYWKDGLRLDDIVQRIFPNFAIHAQKTGRWSTTDPPLAQLPADLRDIVTPDADEVCISWDWSAIEPRVLQALTGSALLKKTFDENFDLHTWTVCYMFGYEFPPDLVDPHTNPSCEAWRKQYNWKGKDDPRRVFAKQGRYEMWYGGTGSNAAQSAASFGLNAKDLKVALTKLATSDPAYYAWKVKTEAEVKQSALIRTFMGRPRRFLSTGDARRREGLDQPMQGAVSDIFNTTIILLAQQHPYLRWGWGMHDSQKWYVKSVDLTPERFEQIKQAVERTHTIGGQVTKFPGDFEIILPPERGNRKVKPKHYFAQAA